MDKIAIETLKRDKEAIKSRFKVTDDAIFVEDDLRVVFPSRYVNRQLAIMGNPVRVVSIYAVIDNDRNYAVVNNPIFINLFPNNITEVDIDGVMYMVLTFDKGNIYTDNRILVKDDKFLYDILDEFIIQGKVPWFMGYEDISNILIESKLYTGRDIGTNPIGMELLSSIITKSTNDKSYYYRQSIKDITDGKLPTPSYAGLMNMYHTMDNNVARLAGSYYSVGVRTAILGDSASVSTIESILRA